MELGSVELGTVLSELEAEGSLLVTEILLSTLIPRFPSFASSCSYSRV